MIVLDTSVLIDHYRKQRKERTLLHQLARQEKQLAISVITQFEILVGSSNEMKPLWLSVFDNLVILPLTPADVELAADIQRDLKKKNKRIGLADVLIASAAVRRGWPMATLNRKHFERIKGLKLYVPAADQV